MTRQSRRELEQAVAALESDDQERGPIVGPEGILAPPEWFGYGGDNESEESPRD